MNYWDSNLHKQFKAAYNEAKAVVANPPKPTANAAQDTSGSSASQSSGSGNSTGNTTDSTSTTSSSTGTSTGAASSMQQNQNPMQALAALWPFLAGAQSNNALASYLPLFNQGQGNGADRFNTLPGAGFPWANPFGLPPGMGMPLYFANSVYLAPPSMAYPWLQGLNGNQANPFPFLSGANTGNGMAGNWQNLAGQAWLASWLQQVGNSGLLNPPSGSTPVRNNTVDDDMDIDANEDTAGANGTNRGRGRGNSGSRPSMDNLVSQLEALVTQIQALLLGNVNSNVGGSTGTGGTSGTGSTGGNTGTPSEQELLNRFLQEKLLTVGPDRSVLEMLMSGLNKANNESDPDLDALAVSQVDLDTLKEALASGDVTRDQVNAAFQWLFLVVPGAAVDELSVLFAQAVDQNVVQVSSLLQGAFLERLDDSRKGVLTRSLANAGLMHSDGQSVNNDLAGWVLKAVSSTNEAEAAFASDLTRSLVEVWVLDAQSPEGQKVFSFMVQWLLPALAQAQGSDDLPASETSPTDRNSVESLTELLQQTDAEAATEPAADAQEAEETEALRQ